MWQNKAMTSNSNIANCRRMASWLFPGNSGFLTRIRALWLSHVNVNIQTDILCGASIFVWMFLHHQTLPHFYVSLLKQMWLWGDKENGQSPQITMALFRSWLFLSFKFENWVDLSAWGLGRLSSKNSRYKFDSFFSPSGRTGWLNEILGHLACRFRCVRAYDW